MHRIAVLAACSAFTAGLVIEDCGEPDDPAQGSGRDEDSAPPETGAPEAWRIGGDRADGAGYLELCDGDDGIGAVVRGWLKFGGPNARRPRHCAPPLRCFRVPHLAAMAPEGSGEHPDGLMEQEPLTPESGAIKEKLDLWDAYEQSLDGNIDSNAPTRGGPYGYAAGGEVGRCLLPKKALCDNDAQCRPGLLCLAARYLPSGEDCRCQTLYEVKDLIMKHRGVCNDPSRPGYVSHPQQGDADHFP